MFGLSGGEFIFIIFVVLMLFGSDKIPELARSLGKGMAQLKNATNDIKSEISKNVAETGFDPNSLTGGISDEIAKAKEGFSRMVNNSSDIQGVQNELSQIEKNFADLTTNPAVPEPVQPALAEENHAQEVQKEEKQEGPIKRRT